MSKIPFCSFCLGSVCLNKISIFFMYARPEQVQTKVHNTILQFPVVTYDMGFLRCAIDVRMVVVYFLCLSNI